MIECQILTVGLTYIGDVVVRDEDWRWLKVVRVVIELVREEEWWLEKLVRVEKKKLLEERESREKIIKMVFMIFL